MREVFATIGRFLVRPKFASGPILLLAGGGLTMIYGEDYTLGAFCLVVAAAWAIVCWLRWEGLKQKFPKKLKTNPTEKQIRAFRLQLRIYHIWKWSGVAIPIILLVGFAFYAESRIQKKEREDVLEKLEISYSVPHKSTIGPFATKFVVINHSMHNISSRHRLDCHVNLVTYAHGPGGMHELNLMQEPNGWWAIMPSDPSKSPIEDTGIVINGGGDVDATSCLAGFRLADDVVKCADLSLTFEYYLADQPKYRQEKQQRIVTYIDEAGEYTWDKDGWNRPNSRCSK